MCARRWCEAFAGAAFAWITGCMAAHAVPNHLAAQLIRKRTKTSPKPSSAVPAQEAPAKPPSTTPPGSASTLDPEQALAQSASCVARLERLGLSIEPITLG